MKKTKHTKIQIVLLALLMAFWLSGCGDSGAKEKALPGNDSREVAQEHQSPPGKTDSKENKTEQTTESGVKSEVRPETDSGKTTATAAAAEKSPDKAAKKVLPAEKKAAEQTPASQGGIEKTAGKYNISIKVDGQNKEVVFSEDDIKNMKTESHTYSFRNKEKNNNRQFEELVGIPLTTILKAAGWNGSADTLRISCSDGYSNRYKLSEINSLLTYKDGSTDSGSKVPAMLAILGEGSYMGNGLYYHYDDGPPYRLVYGQEDFDSDFTKDFNMQGWGYYVTELTIEQK